MRLRVATILGLLSAATAIAPPAFAAVIASFSTASRPVGSVRPSAAARLVRADFSGAPASADARRVADWAIGSGDSHGLPFMIVDKAEARAYLFDARGAILGATPVLLGLARGDEFPPGIGDRPLAMITPAERITPAGRFEAELGRNLSGQDILWVDYAAAISVHRATDSKHGLTANGRLARLASATTSDNRISHGCINVSTAFFEGVLRPAFSGTIGIVYVLPETRSISAVFTIPVAEALAGR